MLAGSALLRRGRARFCDVVEERGQADDEVGRSEVDTAQRMTPDVPAVVAVLREVHGFEQLGNDAREQPGAQQQAQPAARRRAADQQLDQLVAHPLRRDLREDVERGRDRATGAGLQRQPQRAGESHRPQRAQPVLAEAGERIAHGAQPAAPQVLGTGERIAQHARDRIPGDGVHREVAPRQVSVDVAEERHRAGAAAVEIGPLAAEGGHLDLVLRGQDRHGPVLHSRRNDAREELHHLLRQRIGRDVEIVRRLSTQQVAHRAPGNPRLLSCRAQRAQHGHHVGRNGGGIG